jgi:hypothetical protein
MGGPHCLAFDLVQNPRFEMNIYRQQHMSLCADAHLVASESDCPGLYLAPRLSLHENGLIAHESRGFVLDFEQMVLPYDKRLGIEQEIYFREPWSGTEESCCFLLCTAHQSNFHEKGLFFLLPQDLTLQEILGTTMQPLDALFSAHEPDCFSLCL